MEIPEELKYAETHEWVRVQGSEATVGITDHAQAELTQIVYYEPPGIGKNYSAGDAVAVLESVKAASDIYTPVSGTITAINSELESEPGLVNTAPYDEGWLFRIKLSAPSELGSLMNADAYKEHIQDTA